MANRTALVIGASGGVGGEVARTLLARGWRVRALNRNVADAAARKPGLGVEWIGGDAMCPDDVIAAATGASLIVHGANPPGYRNWSGTVIPMLESSIAAARASGARILFPGTIYNYGRDAFPVLRETSPQNPATRKGALRVAMERRLLETASNGVRSVIVRAGDFFGPRSGNSWFAQGLITPGKAVTRVTYPGPPEIGHAWAYLPDVAETMVQLIEREDRLATFDTFHMKGHWFARGDEIVDAIRRVVGRQAPMSRLPWWAIRVASPVVPLFREMSEMRYLWGSPFELDNAKLVSVLGTEPHTPTDDAIRATLKGLASFPCSYIG
ncbi:MAG TPA: SDR family oxidoreductase [Bradyrhizobium sp.]